MTKLLSRNITGRINWLYENLVPLWIRDNYLFASIIFRPVLGKYTKQYLEFKDKAKNMTDEEFVLAYHDMADSFIKRDTDLSEVSIAEIINELQGQSILDAGCGKGFLLKKIKESHPELKLTGVDIYNRVADETYSYFNGSVEKLPFRNGSFDTVICTHTLEHVLDLDRALKELRRVCSKKLIIVVPRQKPMKYTPDLHLRFFPDEKSMSKAFKGKKKRLELLGNDWLYIELMPNTPSLG